MGSARRYRKKPKQFVVAIQLNLETEGFTYQKWGGQQRCEQGDWLVDNGGDIYTIDAKVFASTYRPVAPGTYTKITPVWAEQAITSGRVETNEGISHYQSGDYIVCNNSDGTDTYCVEREKFEEMYELDESKDQF